MKRTLEFIKTDIDILSGETVGPSGSTWQDVAGNCAYNLRDLAALMDLAARRPTAVVSFPAWPTLGE